MASATWYWLATTGISLASPPSAGPQAPPELATAAYYRWFAGTLGQERAYTVLGVLGFLVLAGVAVWARDRLARTDQALARGGTTAVAVGSLLWLVGGLLTIGGHQSIGQMATHANPIETVNAIAFAVDTTVKWFILGALALAGGGLLALADATRARGRAWVADTVLSGVLLLATAALFTVDHGDSMLVIDGLVVLPVWMVWTSRKCVRS